MTEGVVFEAETGKKVAAGAPSLLAMPNGRLLVAFDLTGPDAKGLGGAKGHDKSGRWVQTKVFSSSDAGGKWTGVASLPMRCGRLFRDGGDVWLLGELNGALWVSRSPDGGGSWALPVAVTGEEGYTGRMTRPLRCGGDWAVAAWRNREGGGGEWVLWRAAAGGSLAGKKAWVRGAGTGGAAEALAKGGAPGAGVPAGGVQAGWSDGGALAEFPEGHPWGAGLVGVFAGRGGRADWAVALRAGEGSGEWRGLAGAAVPWAWTRWPGGHAAFSVARDSGGGWWCVGQDGGAKWGQAVHEDGGRRRLGVWWSADAMEWERRGTAFEGSGEGAEAVRRDPSAMTGLGGRLWVACRGGGKESRGARDCRVVRWAEVGAGGKG